MANTKTNTAKQNGGGKMAAIGNTAQAHAANAIRAKASLTALFASNPSVSFALTPGTQCPWQVKAQGAAVWATLQKHKPATLGAAVAAIAKAIPAGSYGKSVTGALAHLSWLYTWQAGMLVGGKAYGAVAPKPAPQAPKPAPQAAIAPPAQAPQPQAA